MRPYLILFTVFSIMEIMGLATTISAKLQGVIHNTTKDYARVGLK